MKAAFWIIIHNVIAHPLLFTYTKWAERFHDWTFEKYEAAERSTVPNTFKLDNDFKPVYQVEVEKMDCGFVYKSHGNTIATDTIDDVLNEAARSIKQAADEVPKRLDMEIVILVKYKP